MKASLRARHAEAGVLRCFKYRNKVRYALMSRDCAVRYCREWIKVLRVVRGQNPDDIAEA